MGWLIKTNGQIQQVKPKNPPEFSLDELQSLVGGMIELIPEGRLVGGFVTGKGTVEFKCLQAYINEEGKLRGLPINPMATCMYVYGDQDPIVGDMIVCEENETS